MACDAAALFFATLAGHALLAVLGAGLPVSALLHATLMATGTTLLLRACGAYSDAAVLQRNKHLELLVLSIIGLVAAFIAVAHMILPFDATPLFPTKAIVPTVFIASICIGVVTLVRIALCSVLEAMAARNLLRQIAVLDCGMCRRHFMFQLQDVQPQLTSLVGVFQLSGDAVLRRRGRGLDELVAAVRSGQIDDIVLTVPRNPSDDVLRAIQRLRELPVNIHVATSDRAPRRSAGEGSFADLPLRTLFAHRISGWGSVVKSMMDVTLAGAITIVISPLLLLIALAIRIESPGPVIFRQRRMGLNQREFTIFKFRSMYHREVPEARVRQATRDDPRVTRVGSFLRRTSLDELPQLFNVLNGTMSLIGPRPHALSHDVEYSRQIRHYASRHRAKPGITGWAQVNGLRGETEVLRKMIDRVDHDCYYIDNWSPFLDIKILFMTVFVVFFQDTAY